MDDRQLNEIMQRMVEALRRSREMNVDYMARVEMASEDAGRVLVDEVEKFLEERNETGNNG